MGPTALPRSQPKSQSQAKTRSHANTRSRQWMKQTLNAQHDSRLRRVRAYRKLDFSQQEIRLLVVDPGCGLEPVQCSFRYARLKALRKPQYETISYVWGNASVRAKVSLEGQYVSVPASSERALRQFRLIDQQRTLWIDAVCINQDDQGERNNQVAMMYEIYSRSAGNLIWLGNDDGTASAALDGICLLVNDMRAETKDFTDVTNVIYDEERDSLRIASAGLPFSLLPRQIDAIARFYSCPWFQRLWVLQEAALAPRNMCYRGDVEFPLPSVLRAATWIWHKAYQMPNGLIGLRGVKNASRMFEYCDNEAGRYRSPNLRPDMLAMLLDVRNFLASDPKDHAFAIFGLVVKYAYPDDMLQLLRPDYSKTTSVIFCDMARTFIRSRQNLAILNLYGHHLTDESPLSLPTWVLAWNYSWDKTIYAVQLPWSDFNACSIERSRVKIFQQSYDPCLTVTGMVMDESEFISQGISPTAWEKLSEMYLHVFASSNNSCATFTSPDRLELAMTLTAGCDHVLKRWSNDSCMMSSINYDKAVEGEGIAFLPELTAASTENARLASEFAQAIGHACRHRCLFYTKSGQFGLGPQIMQAGDTVAILYGCRLPVVLRRVKLSEGKYEFVGTCYVYGVMDGEAVEAHIAAGKEDDVFTLV